MPDSRYRINAPLVACQTLEGESVLIHFETGCYFSADRLGAEVIVLVEKRRSVAEIAARVAALSGCGGAEGEGLATAFLAKLAAEGLIVADAGAAPTEELPPAGAPCPGAVPELRKFTDLQDLLLLDPIHDAGDAGWPAKPGPGA
ncbi:MAG: PqqD family protein [Candidatus Brocadiae bacterium]|nr:PqqD family protein [Candidatus Brocadiia bacterium]